MNHDSGSMAMVCGNVIGGFPPRSPTLSTTVKGQLFLTLASLSILETRGIDNTNEKNAILARVKISSIVDANATLKQLALCACIQSKVQQFSDP